MEWIAALIILAGSLIGVQLGVYATKYVTGMKIKILFALFFGCSGLCFSETDQHGNDERLPLDKLSLFDMSCHSPSLEENPFDPDHSPQVIDCNDGYY